jgi:hypothetical protein
LVIDRNTRDQKNGLSKAIWEGEWVLLEAKILKVKIKNCQKFIRGHSSL